MTKHQWTRLIQLLVTVAILGWIFSDQKLRSEMWAVLKTADPLWLLAGLLVGATGDASNIVRWGIFLRVQGIDTPWPRIARVFLAGLFFNLILPGSTGGDVVRLLYMVREEHRKKTAVVLSVLVDRLIGLLVLIPYALVIVWWRYDWLSQTPSAEALLFFLIGFLAISTVILLSASVVSYTRLLAKLPERFPFREKLVKISDAYHLFTHHWKATLLAILLSIPVIYTYFGVFYCAARAFNADVSLLDLFSIMPIVAVITSFPISFSGLGVREKLFENLLSDLAGTPAGVAVLISLTGFIIYVVLSLVGGLFYLSMKPATREEAKHEMF
jgi:uncharacterized protein (TIRG00374 family)